MSSLLAIDPGSNKLGLAWFSSGVLIAAKTLVTSKTSPLERRLDMANKIAEFVDLVDDVASEEPLLLGRNNNFMQRLLGYIELLTNGKVWMIHPMTLKKFMNSGTSDKLDMALAAGKMLQSEDEKEILAKLITEELEKPDDEQSFDATDAVCVGLAYLKRGENDAA